MKTNPGDPTFLTASKTWTKRSPLNQRFNGLRENEVINMTNPSDLSKQTIQNLFYQQIKQISRKTCAEESFDMQFNGSWI